MIDLNQIKRVLKHCENVDAEYKKMDVSINFERTGIDIRNGEKFLDYTRNKGWIEALRLVLGENTQISNKPLEKDDA